KRDISRGRTGSGAWGNRSGDRNRLAVSQVAGGRETQRCESRTKGDCVPFAEQVRDINRTEAGGQIVAAARRIAAQDSELIGVVINGAIWRSRRSVCARHRNSAGGDIVE